MKDSAWSLFSGAIVMCALVTPGYADATRCALRVWSQTRDQPAVITGTAVYGSVGDKHVIVTSYHVVRQKQSVFIAYNDKSGYLPIADFVEDSFVCSPATDLAVFFCTATGIKELTGSRFKRIPIRISSSIPAEKGWQVLVVGNPNVTLFQKTARHEYFPLNAVASANIGDQGKAKDRLGDVVKGQAVDTNLLMLDSFKVTYGFSGGPILFQHPKAGLILVGLLQGGDPSTGLSTWGVDSSHILDTAKMSPTIKLSTPEWPAPQFTEKAYAAPGVHSEMHFPIAFPGVAEYQEDRFKNGMWWMKSNVVLSGNGKINGLTHIGTEQFLQGWRGEVIVFLCDEIGNVLWHTQERHRWGVPVGAEKVREDEPWEEDVPRDILAVTRIVRILHRRSPKDSDEIYEDVLKSVSGRKGQRLSDLERSFSVKVQIK